MPGAAGPLARLTTALRPRSRLALGRLLKVDQVATDVKAGDRAAYEARAIAGQRRPDVGP